MCGMMSKNKMLGLGKNGTLVMGWRGIIAFLNKVSYCFAFVIQTVMRVWDVLFNEGARVLLKVALAIFKVRHKRQPCHHSYIQLVLSKFQRLCCLMIDNLYHQIKEGEILSKHTIGEIVNLLQETTRTFYDPDKLLKVGCSTRELCDNLMGFLQHFHYM